MNLDQVLTKFAEPRKSGKGWKVRCPSHEDKVNSLSIFETGSGKILLNCHAGCSTKAVIDAVELTWRDLSGGDGDQNLNKSDPVTARYVYVDENSKPLFRVCRTRSKRFFQERFEAE